MFGDSSQNVFSAVNVFRGKIVTDGTVAPELTFVICIVRGAPMKAVTIPKLGLRAADLPL